MSRRREPPFDGSVANDRNEIAPPHRFSLRSRGHFNRSLNGSVLCVTANPCHCALDRVRPAFRECQCRCREVPPLPLARPRLPLRLNAVADEARAERWYQYSTYAVAPVGDLVRLRVDEQRLADIEPSERDIFAVRPDVLSPEVAGISSLGKRRLRTRDCCVGKFGIEHALYSRLQQIAPSRCCRNRCASALLPARS